jgi:hypothetical protein
MPNILADGGDAVPPDLSELARGLSDWVAAQVRHGHRCLPFLVDGGDAVSARICAAWRRRAVKLPRDRTGSGLA